VDGERALTAGLHQRAEGCDLGRASPAGDLEEGVDGGIGRCVAKGGDQFRHGRIVGAFDQQHRRAETRQNA
jgi:hypothetical protein